MASGENLLYILLMKMLSGNDEHFKRLYLLYFFSLLPCQSNNG